LTYFKALTELLVAAGTGNVASEELIKFGHKIHDSNFLFGKDISNYLKENFDNAADLNSIHEQFKEASLLNEEEKIRLVKKRTELEKWFYRQFEISKRKILRLLSANPESVRDGLRELAPISNLNLLYRMGGPRSKLHGHQARRQVDGR